MEHSPKKFAMKNCWIYLEKKERRKLIKINLYQNKEKINNKKNYQLQHEAVTFIKKEKKSER